MENKRGILSTVFLVVAIILIAVMGTVMYMQKTENDRQISELREQLSKLEQNNVINEGENGNTEKEENEINKVELKEGTYSFVNNEVRERISQDNKFPHILLETHIKFENNNFKVYDNGQIFTSGKYEEAEDNLIKCIISDERSFEIKIIEENKIEITKINSNDDETEFNIRLYDILGKGNKYALYEESNLEGTWRTTYVYEDMDGGDFVKIEEHFYDETFTFNNDGTYNLKEYRVVDNGTYELEKNRIYISEDKTGYSEIYLIDKDTILYTLGTDTKIILFKEK